MFIGMRNKRSGGQLNNRRWVRLRDQVVREEPFCQLRLPGCTLKSTTADHINPVKYRPDLKFVRVNLRGSCRSCNMKRGSRPLSEVRARSKSEQPNQHSALEFFT